MPIKLKKMLAIDSSDPLLKHIENVLAPSQDTKSEYAKSEYAKKKLEVMGKAKDLIEKNKCTLEKNANSDPLKTAKTKDNLVVLSNIVKESKQENGETQQLTIHEYLSQQADFRKENQIVYGKSLSSFSLMFLGVGLVESSNQPDGVFFKKKLITTETYSSGTVEFGITYDNKIFITPKCDGEITNNLYKMAQGTLLKAVGRMQIGNRESHESVQEGEAYSKILEGQIKYISVDNSFFDVLEDNIAISLFALNQLGIDLSETQVVVPNDASPLIDRFSDCYIKIHGDLQNASYYLDENRFPGAKNLAEKKLNFSDKVIELFSAIDDEVLLQRNKQIIKDIYGEKELLKLNLIKLFNCCKELEQTPKKDGKRVEAQPGLFKNINQPFTSSQAIAEQISVSASKAEETVTGTFNDYWQAITASLLLFKEKNIDLNFLVSEINMIVAYILHNGLTTEEKDQLNKWTTAKIPGRGLDPKAISDYIKFYEHDPIKTCITLLQDYSKGMGWQGMICRFFSGAWNRNYKDSVNEFLSIYTKNELPDNISICGIYEKLKDAGLIFNYDAESKSSLRKILLFCAKLNNEEDHLLHLILNLSYTSFTPLDSDDSCSSCIERCC